MKKKLIAIFIVLSILLVNTNLIAGQEYDYKESIKIGLRSGTSAVSLAHINSDTGFKFGYRVDNNEEFIELNSFEDKDIHIRMDDYFIKSGDSYYSYTFSSESNPNDSKLEGPIHVEIGDGFSSRAEAEEYIDYLEGFGLQSYLALDSKWNVWLGKYNTYNQAEESLEYVKNIFPEINATIVSKNSNRIQVLDSVGEILMIYYPDYGNYFFKPINSETVMIDNKVLRGEALFKNSTNGRITIINYLTIEDYLYGVVPKEVVHTWNMEALKAQAVAARTYAIANMGKHENEGYNLCASTNCQVYGGYSSEKESTNIAVNETNGIIMMYNEKPISAYYHHSSGGYTENSENIWTSEVGYLKGVLDQFVEKKVWEKSFTTETVIDKLNNAGYNTGTIKDIYVDEYSQFGSALKLVIEGENSTVVLEKDGIRKIFGYSNIKSTKFEIVKENNKSILGKNFTKSMDIYKSYVISADSIAKPITRGKTYIFNGTNSKVLSENTNYIQDFTIRGLGWGHSLGMSQMGAKAYAENGYTYEQILTHYYSGIELIKGE